MVTGRVTIERETVKLNKYFELAIFLEIKFGLEIKIYMRYGGGGGGGGGTYDIKTKGFSLANLVVF